MADSAFVIQADEFTVFKDFTSITPDSLIGSYIVTIYEVGWFLF